jgi:AraC-like DNA-binding protein
VHLTGYAILAFQYLRSLGSLTNGALKLKRWHAKIVWAFSGYVVSFILYFTMVWTKTIKVEYDYMISAASSFFIYFIGYYGFQKPEVLKMNEAARYDKSSLGMDASLIILKEIKVYFDLKQPYLRSDLKLTDVAQELKYSVHLISQVLNEYESTSFNDFVNSYRIELAKRLLRENATLKIMHVAYDSGYNNKASFNNAFKKITGKSPSEYRDSQLASAESAPIG